LRPRSCARVLFIIMVESFNVGVWIGWGWRGRQW
jgi:hypothetical protein